MREIPLFPLNAVLFPGIPLHLFIFEERYRHMVRRSLERDSLLGIVLIKQGVEALGPLPKPYTIGTLGQIIEYEVHEDGSMNITVIGLERFHIIEMNNGHEPYLTGLVESDPVELPNMLNVHRQSRHLVINLQAYLHGLSRSKIENVDFSHFSPPDDPLALVYLAAALLQIPPHEKQPILEANSVNDMMMMVGRLYRRENGLMPMINSTEDQSARRMAWLN
jgi:Lon protease-like protein